MREPWVPPEYPTPPEPDDHHPLVGEFVEPAQHTPRGDLAPATDSTTDAGRGSAPSGDRRGGNPAAEPHIPTERGGSVEPRDAVALLSALRASTDVGMFRAPPEVDLLDDVDPPIEQSGAQTGPEGADLVILLPPATRPLDLTVPTDPMSASTQSSWSSQRSGDARLVPVTDVDVDVEVTNGAGLPVLAVSAIPAVPAPPPVPTAARTSMLGADRLHLLPGATRDDPFDRLAAAWLIGIPATRTRTAYAGDLRAWATWCAHHGIHPLAVYRWHVEAFTRHLAETPSLRTGRVRAPATIARMLSALSEVYAYGLSAGVLTHSPVANVRRPRVSPESQSVGLDAEQCRHLLHLAAEHSPRAHALASVLLFTGVRVGEALGADVVDLSTDVGHRILWVTRKGGRRARVVLPAAAVRAVEAHLDGQTSGPLFCTQGRTTRWQHGPATRQLRRLFAAAGLSPSVTAHSLRHSWVTTSLSLGVPLQDVQDAAGHADPRTTMRYNRARDSLLIRVPSGPLLELVGVAK